MNPVLRRFAIATWAAAAGLVVIFTLFWRIAYAPPHAIWAIVTTGAVVVTGVLTILVGLRQFIRGPRRTLIAATVLLGTTPIAWLAMFILSLFLQATTREPTTFNTPTRIAAFWAISIADVEARWRYPRWTHGKHVILLDDNQTPEPAKLVAQMDEHIEQMAALLHATVPEGLGRWVRGSLLGFHGNAIISWAICDADQSLTELKPLDRHEMAHVLITVLGSVDQDPPMLLCEGWAESQSKDRAELILTLDRATETVRVYSLQELVGSDWYGRSAGPAYDHGGPLCVYLMEHYGVEKFLTLYHGVRSATFATDSERILGDSWNVVNDNFWKWLSSEAAKIKTERGAKSAEPLKDITFADSVDPSDWQTIVEGYRSTWSKRPPLPSAFAYVTEREWANTPKEPGGAPDKHGLVSKSIVDRDSVWMVRNYGPERFVQGEVFTPAISAAAAVMADGSVSGPRSTDKSSITDAIEDATHWTDACDAAHYLPIVTNRGYLTNSHVEAIRRPAPPDRTEWEIDITSRKRDSGEETKFKLHIDEAADWSVVRAEESSADEQSESRWTMGSVLGRHAAIETVVHTNNKSRTSQFQSRFRELSPAEAAEVREQAEAIARRRPTNWFAMFARPATWAIAWPATGVVLLIAGIGMGRRAPT